MNAQKGFELLGCEENAVVSVELKSIDNQQLIAYPMFTAGKLMAELTKRFLRGLSEEDRKTLLEDGLSCQILRAGKGWKPAKVRVRVLIEVYTDD